jgi:Leucine-rich repeat (LRR) protein
MTNRKKRRTLRLQGGDDGDNIFKIKDVDNDDDGDDYDINDITVLYVTILLSDGLNEPLISRINQFVNVEELLINGSSTNVKNLNFGSIVLPKLKILKVTGFKFLESLMNIPQSITNLDCNNNVLTSLDNLPQNLVSLNCSNNRLTSLDKLPQNLESLICSSNQLTSLDHLPTTLDILRCSNNKLTSLDNLPTTLELLICSNNKLTTLKYLPDNLRMINCQDNQLTNIKLPTKLTDLNCQNNQLTIKGFLFDEDGNFFGQFPEESLTRGLFFYQGNPFTDAGRGDGQLPILEQIKEEYISRMNNGNFIRGGRRVSSFTPLKI